MNLNKFLDFVWKNVDILSVEDIKLIINGKYTNLLKRLNDKYISEDDKKEKKKIERLVDFLSDFIEDYKKSAYKYNYIESTELHHFEYWFNFYLKNKFLDRAKEVLNDAKKKFPEHKKIKKLAKKLNKEKSWYKEEYQRIKYETDRKDKIMSIENLIEKRLYTEAQKRVFAFLKDYPDDNTWEKLLAKVNKLKSRTVADEILVDNEFFEKVWLLKIVEKGKVEKRDLREIYKKLKYLVKTKDFDTGLSLIKYVKEEFEVEDTKLLWFYDKLLEHKRKYDKEQQEGEYKLELKSLKLLIKNKQFKDASAKANNILKKYVFINKNEVFRLIKKINSEKKKVFKNKNKWKFEIWFEEFMMRIASLNKKQLFNFYEKLAWFLKAKMDLKLTLQIIFYQAREFGLKKFTRDVVSGIESGMKLSEIMKFYPVISKLDVSLVKIWEATWQLWEMFQRIYKSRKEEEARKKQIKSVMIYPSIIISITLWIFLLMLIFIMPKFVTFFQSAKIELPALTKILLAMSAFVRQQWYVVLIWVILSILWFTYFAKTKLGEYVIWYFSMRLPVIKEIVTRKYVIYFSGNLSLLLNSGIDLLEAMDLLVVGTENPWYRNEFKRIRFELETGVNFSKAVWLWKLEEIWSYKNMFIPIDLSYAIDAWERTWQLWTLLQDVWERYEEDLKLIIKNLQSLMEPLIIALVGTVVFTFVLAIFLPMMKMYDAVGKMWWL